MAKPQKSSGGLCFPCIIIFVGWLFILGFYCHFNFPKSLKGAQAEPFDSHALLDINQILLPNDTLKSSKFLKNDPIGICQDIEINSKGIIYCASMNGKILTINPKTEQTTVLGNISGLTYGSRLSSDEKILYFLNSQKGLCQIDLQTKQITSLVSEYEGKHLLSMNSIEVHPTKPNVLFLTQSNPDIPMYQYSIDIILNKPHGRLYKFDKSSKSLELLADKFYFTNGIVFQKYKGQQTVLVAQTNRNRLIRVYTEGARKGEKQVAVDGIHVFLDNMKANKNGDIWIGGPSPRDDLTYFADHHPLARTIVSRLPTSIIDHLANLSYMGGLKLVFSQDKSTAQAEYFVWKSIPDFSFVTAIRQHQGSIYMSSLHNKGILMLENVLNSKSSSFIKGKKVTAQKEKKAAKDQDL